MGVVNGIYLLVQGMPPSHVYRFQADEFGNLLLPVFTDPDAALGFQNAYASEFRADGFGPLDALEIITQSSKAQTEFFALDPKSPSSYASLELHELLHRFVALAYQAGQEGIEPWFGALDCNPVN